MKKGPSLSPESRVQHPRTVETAADNPPLNIPIFQNVKWRTESVAEGSRIMRGERDGFFYSRVANPTVRQLERLLAELQGREECLAVASGVNAIAQALIGLTRSEDHIICFAESYGPTRQIIRQMLARFGVSHTMLSIDDLSGLERELAARPTRLVMLESPTNPINKIADLGAITAVAHRHGALCVLDNTAAGVHQHGEYEIDLFIHSLTKFATGAGEVMGGAVIGNASVLRELRPDFGLFGAQIDPQTAFVMLNGFKTYFARYRAQSAAAMHLAGFLARHPSCARVRYPGLGEDAQGKLARAQMRDFGCVITFDHRDGAEAGRRFAEHLQLFARAASFGSTESLVMPPQWLQPRELTDEERHWAGIGPGTIRLSIGLESVEELETDLAQALEASLQAK